MRMSRSGFIIGLVLISGLLAACSMQKTPMSGEWMAAVDFGRIGFTVASDGGSIPQSRYDVYQFDCSGSTISAGVQHENESGWAIENGVFHDQTNLNTEGTEVIDVTVTFAENGLWAYGSYEIVLPNGSCSGEFEAFPNGMGAAY